MFTVPLEWWSLLVGTLLPAAVALVRARYAASNVGALLLVALTTIGAVLAEVFVDDAGAAFSWSDVGEQFVVLYIIAVVGHFGLLKPLRVTGSEGAIAKAVPAGVG